MSSINLDNPYLLLLAVPIIALFAIPFAIAIRKDNVNAHNVASGIIHVIMALIIAFVAAGTSVVTTVTQTDVYVLADVSYSANKNLDTIDSYISDLSKSLPDNSRMGIICFGRDHQLLTRLGERVKSVKNNSVDDTATDIVGALEYAGSLFRTDVIKRIVLITDGKQTNESDPNALKRQADALADRKIHVDAIYLNDNIKDDAQEVQLTSVELTQVASLNRSESAVVTVNCNCPESTTINGEIAPYEVEAVFTLTRGGEEYEKISETLRKGTNYISLNLPTDKEGVFDYELSVSAEEDDNKHNNKISFTQTVSGELNILLIASSDEEVIQLRKIYGDSAKVDAFTYIKDPTIPCSVEELCLYDEIVLSNVDVSQIHDYKMFLESLDTAVSLFGKSLVTYGDTYIQSHIQGELSILSSMLPVTFGKSDSDKKLYMLVIDTSRSMQETGGGENSKISVAKTVATEIVNLLSDNDSVGIVSFDGQAHNIWAPQSLDTGRELVLDKIKNLSLRNGTDIGSGLRAALDQMKISNFGEKRVMLISDGLNFVGGDSTEKVEDIVKEMRNYSIYTSVLDAGRGGDTGAASTSAQKLLSNAAKLGGGAYMDVSKDDKLENVLNSELPSDVNKPEGGTSDVHVKRRNDEVLKNGITDNAELFAKLNEAYVKNFIYSVAKSSATTVLTVDYYNSGLGTSVECPLYSYWNYGNGRVASFTSAMTGPWTNTLNGALKEKLFENIMQTSVPTNKLYAPFLLDIYAHDGYVDVTLTPETVRPDAKTKITVTSPDESVTEGTLAFGTSSFTYDFVTLQTGKYKISVYYSYGGREYTVERYVDLSYSSEYDSFALYDSAVLNKMLGANGTVSEDGKLKIENDASEVGVYNLSLVLPLLIVCVVLYIVDIGVRKLKWEDIQSLFKKIKRGKK